MSVYLVTWDLNKEGLAYNSARDRLMTGFSGLTNYKDPDLDSVRFVHSPSTVQQIVDYLRQFMDSNDSLFVTRLRSEEYKGWMASATWDWIRTRL